ncbi:HD-GYP domain-containing protein [Shewanella sp. NIFS-20-20]|uniref:HD-GYP domain-containing protein n=1 Tax=Shewanella sp. NIFS-20-20 TaxID=2853806 RepID=UPI001C489FD3|nr:HD-GYP domain-containing protein [Shewanella sp. NIFS-20-20]MBV7316029.1 HD-GYP domain-containing protein [Shewanella sp. NIFS-20-20]
MDSSAVTEELLKIPVTKLAVGMYVTAIENNGKVAIANAGQVKNKEAIRKILTSGIKFVWVDIAKSAKGSMPSVKKKAAPTGNRSVRQQNAKKILGEAKGLIKKVMGEIYEGKAIEVEPFAALADSMIESVMLDVDAFKCISALRSKDAYLLEHSVNVAFLLVTFGRHLKLDKELMKQIAIGGILHDVGKIRVDNKVLHKPGKLSPEEFEHMKLHQVYALEEMEAARGLSQISKDVCLMHHEKLDGKGYPCGLKGDELPLHGRMSCICDIFDALTATRCYKQAMSPAAAFKILLSLTPFHLDQQLVYEFIRCVGVYPVGSLVELSDGRVGIVWDAKDRDALHPVVKCFYSLKHYRYTEVDFIDLNKSELEIERGVSPSSLDVDPTPFY